jgi:glycosyltransferase family protein
LSVEECIRRIAEERCSIARFGDGELDIAMGKAIPFQEANAELAAKLRRILVKHTPGLLVGLPPIFEGLDNLNHFAVQYYLAHLRYNRLAWYRATSRRETYGNTFITRYYMDKVDKSQAADTVRRLKGVWENRDIVLVEGEESRLGIGNDLFANTKSVRRIIGPKRNAFARYGALLTEAQKLEKESLFILALGPTATAMAHDLHVQGYQALDLGHVDIEYEWFRMGATEKVPVKNKYTNEALHGTDVGELADPTYARQIVARAV